MNRPPGDLAFLLESITVIEQAAEEAALHLFLFLAAADGIIIDDIGIELLFRAVEDGIGTAAAVPGSCQASRIDQIDPVEVLAHGYVGVAETGSDAVVFLRKIEQVVTVIACAFDMAVGDEQLSVRRLDDLSVGAGGAVAVSLYGDDGNAQGVFQGVCVSLIIAAVDDQIYMIQLLVNLIDLVQKSMGIAQ